MMGSLVHHIASCHDCDLYVDAKNAQGVGASHAEATGHRVSVELSYTYGGGDE